MEENKLFENQEIFEGIFEELDEECMYTTEAACSGSGCMSALGGSNGYSLW